MGTVTSLRRGIDSEAAWDAHRAKLQALMHHYQRHARAAELAYEQASSDYYAWRNNARH
jgi:hypothetical protein